MLQMIVYVQRHYCYIFHAVHTRLTLRDGSCRHVSNIFPRVVLVRAIMSMRYTATTSLFYTNKSFHVYPFYRQIIKNKHIICDNAYIKLYTQHAAPRIVRVLVACNSEKEDHIILFVLSNLLLHIGK